MESQLLERIYSGPRRASTWTPTLKPTETVPLGYEQAFGAYARRTCDILAPDDFARDLIHHDGMDFLAFVEVNHIELLDDDDALTVVTTYPDPTSPRIEIAQDWEVSGLKALEGPKE